MVDWDAQTSPWVTARLLNARRALFNHSDPPAFGNDQEEKGLGNEITNNSFINARHNLRFSTGYAGLPQGIIQTPETENR